jgi:hypothetical protein
LSDHCVAGCVDHRELHLDLLQALSVVTIEQRETQCELLAKIPSREHVEHVYDPDKECLCVVNHAADSTRAGEMICANRAVYSSKL